MQKSKIIRLDKTVFFTREQAKKLGAAIRKNRMSKVIIDFSAVHFISRAFADEWLNELEKTKSKKTVSIRHANPDIKKMIQVVKRKKNEIRKQLSG